MSTKNQINGLIRDRVKEIIKLQNSIELNELSNEPKSWKHNFSKVSLPIIHKHFMNRRC